MFDEQTEQSNRLRRALEFAALGIGIIPLAARSKRPALKGGVHQPLLSKKAIKKHFGRNPDHNYGVATGVTYGLFVLDVDGRKGRAALAKLQGSCGALPKTFTVSTNRGIHLYFQCRSLTMPVSNRSLAAGLDVRGDGGYVVGPRSRHASGKSYRIRLPNKVAWAALAEAPDWLCERVSKKEAAPRHLDSLTPPIRSLAAYGEAALTAEVGAVVRATPGARNATLNRAAFRLGQIVELGVLSGETVARALTAAAVRVGLADFEIAATIRSGLEAGAQLPRPTSHASTTEVPTDDLAARLSSLEMTDTDNSTRFLTRYGKVVRFSDSRGWLRWRGKVWECAHERGLRELAIVTAEGIAGEAAHLQNPSDQVARRKFAQATKSSAAISRMLNLAEHQATCGELDPDDDLLNVQNGVVDLRSGTLAPHDPFWMTTKITGSAYDPGLKIPHFRRLLQHITGGDKEFAGYLQRAVGYSLTGRTDEQFFFYLFGPGATGKSTFLTLLGLLLGDYACHTPIETLLTKQIDNGIPSDLARLQGARFVSAVEPNFNRQLDEGRIKAMTGGDPITARFLRHEWFEFLPKFKLWIAANDFPRVRGTAKAFWRRVQVIPFSNVVGDDQRDGSLNAKLAEEMPGILAWAVEGAVRWSNEGLGSCAKVSTASTEWRAAADHLIRFISEECLIDAEGRVQSLTLYEAYRAWCVDKGEAALSVGSLKSELSAKGYLYKKTKRAREWRGIRLRSDG